MSSSGRDLTREQIIELLSEVGQVLQEQGLTASVYVVGGTAMTLTLNSRRTTRDVDAAIRDHRDEFLAAARTVAERHQLDEEWVSTAATAFLTSEPDRAEGGMTLPGLRVAIISPEHLLAMKIRAFRGKDYDDLERLFNFLRITDPQQAADITNALFDDTYPGRFDPDEALYVAQDIFTMAAKRGRPIGGLPLSREVLESATRAGGGWATTAQEHGEGGRGWDG